MRNFILIGLLIGLLSCQGSQEEALRKEVLDWREARIEELKSPEGFIDLAGLYWLDSGRSALGSGSTRDVIFPEAFPEDAGNIVVTDTTVRYEGPQLFTDQKGNPVRNGQPIFSKNLSVELQYRNYWFYVIERAGEYGIRVKQTDHPNLTAPLDIEYFPISSSWVIEATFEPYDPPRKIPIQNVVGQTYEVSSPGRIVFNLAGNTYSLDPTVRGDDFFITFGDKTNGAETYGAGRYLYAPMPKNGQQMILNFNKAYNPPCVFTAFATCPLPPPQNQLTLAITAGEKEFHWNENY